MKTWYSIQNVAADVAEISIFDGIGEWGVTAKSFLDEALALPVNTIRVMINSPGGSVFDALTMLNGLKAKGKRVECVVLGMAASAASVFAMGADHVRMPANTFQFIHNPLTGCYGNAEEMRTTADALDLVGTSIRGMYARRWKGTDEELTAALAAESYFTAAQCLENGLCDEVTDELPIKASFDIERVPESVRQHFQASKPTATPPTPAPVETPLAERISAAAAAAGMTEFAAGWALQFDDMAPVQAAISNAREVKALCVVAGKSDLAAAFITASKPLADVRAELTAALEADAEQTHVSGAQRTSNPQAIQINTAEVYAKANQHVKRA
jgi:ATP-dependent protease ClpP protease subunit